MIESAANRITLWMVRQKIIRAEEQELYGYAVYSGIMNMMPVVLAVIIGKFLGDIAGALIFICPFMFIRKYSGGYHAKREWICLVTSSFLLAVFLYTAKWIHTGSTLSVILFLVAVLIYVCSPIDSEARKLELCEVKKYKCIAGILAGMFFILYNTLVFAGRDKEAVLLAWGMVLTFSLQIPCVLRKLHDSRTYKNKRT